MNSITPAQHSSALPSGMATTAQPHGSNLLATQLHAAAQAAPVEVLLDADDRVLFTGNRHAAAAPGIAALLTLLRELRPELQTLLPASTAQLLTALQQQVIGWSELGDFRRLRQQLLREPPASAPTIAADPAATASTGAANEEPATLLLQLLQSLQWGRKVVVANGTVSFAAAQPVTAYCLQAYAEEQRTGSPWKRLRALLLSNAEAAVQNLLNVQVAGLNHNTAKIPQRIMQLLLQRDSEVLAVPVTLSRHADAASEIWKAEFDLDLAEAGTLHVVLAVKNSAVSVSLLASRSEFAALLQQRRQRLASNLGNLELALATFAVAGTAHGS